MKTFLCLLCPFLSCIVASRSSAAPGNLFGGPLSALQTTQAIYSAATLLKNGDVGLDANWRWESTFYNSNRAARVLSFFDQPPFPGGSSFMTEAIRQGRAHEGGITSGGSDVGALRINTNGLVYQLTSAAELAAVPNIVFAGTPYWMLTNGAAITWDRIGAGSGITDTNLNCDTFKMSYITEPLAGNLTVSLSSNGSAFGTVTTLNANQAGTSNGVVYSLSLPSGNYVFRVSATSGTNRIWDAAAYNSTTKTYAPGFISLAGGTSFQTVTNCQTNVWLTFMQGWNPDLILAQDTGGAVNGPAIQYLDPLLPSAATNADRVYMGWITADVYPGNFVMQQFAVTNGNSVSYFDISSVWATNDFDDLIVKGIMSADRVHVTSYGAAILDRMLWDRIMRTHTVTNGAYYANIPISGIVSPGPIITNGATTAYYVANDWTVKGTLITTGSTAGISINSRNGNTANQFYSPDGNNLNMWINGTDFLHLYTNNSGQVSLAPEDGAGHPMDLGDGQQGFRNVWQQTANNAYWQHGQISEQTTLNTGATTTDTAANLLPANSIIEAVVIRVTTTITTAASFSIGDATTAARFSASAGGLTAGSTRVGIDHWSGAVTTLATGPSQAAAAKLRYTFNANPGAGAIRATVFFKTFVPPGN